MGRVARIKEGEDVVALTAERGCMLESTRLLWFVCVMLNVLNMSHDLTAKYKPNTMQ